MYLRTYLSGMVFRSGEPKRVRFLQGTTELGSSPRNLLENPCKPAAYRERKSMAADLMPKVSLDFVTLYSILCANCSIIALKYIIGG